MGIRPLLCLGLALASASATRAGTTVQNCTHNAFLSVYITDFSSAGCLDQNLLFSNFQYTPTSAAALTADEIFATRPADNDPLRGLGFFSPGWIQPPNASATSVLTFTVTAIGGPLLTGNVLTLSGGEGSISLIQVCLSGCVPAPTLEATPVNATRTAFYTPVASITVSTQIRIRGSGTFSGFDEGFLTTTPEVPEPAGISLMSLGLLGLALFRRRSARG